MYMCLIKSQGEVCGVCTSHLSMCDTLPSAQLVSAYNPALLKRETMRIAINLTSDVDDLARILNYAVALLMTGSKSVCLLVIDGLCCRKLSTKTIINCAAVALGYLSISLQRRGQ